MALPSASIAACWIKRDISNSDFMSVKEILTQILEVYIHKKSREEIIEITESLFIKVTQELKNSIADDLSDGVHSRFVIEGDDNDAYIKVLEIPEIAILPQLKKITPAQFEIVCTQILIQLGATSERVELKDDRGVDFFGYDLNMGIDKGPAPENSKVFIIGQAKCYKQNNFVKEAEIKKFVGAAFHKTQELKRAMSGKLGGLTPISYAFWTTSVFYPDAKKYAKDLGIWYLNGIGLVQLANRVGITSLVE